MTGGAKRTAAVLAMLAAMAAGAAAAQTNSAEIVVTAEQVRERANAYTEAIALAPTSAEQYARWDQEICPRVAGLPAADAQALIDHIARRAHELGIDTGAAGCQPNLVIMFAPNGNTVAREIVDTRRDLMGYYGEENTITAGRDALEAFANTSRPVRWWHVSQTMSADGRALGDRQAQRAGAGADSAAANAAAEAGGPPIGGGQFEGASAVRSTGQRTRRDTRQDLSFALVIVDAPSVAAAPPQATADYVAMAALAQLNPDADMSAFPSILNLFRPGQQALTGMTEWDAAFLQGLYRTRRESGARQQRSDIARRMAERIPTN
jgi:hypothetical protein